MRASADVGTIICTGLRDEIDLHANVGDLRATYASDAPAALHATMETNVGSIEFTGPPEISADLTAKANVGDINTDRPHHRQGVAQQALRAGLARPGRRPGEPRHQCRFDPNPVICYRARRATANPAPATHSAGGSTFITIRSRGVSK